MSEPIQTQPEGAQIGGDVSLIASPLQMEADRQQALFAQAGTGTPDEVDYGPPSASLSGEYPYTMPPDHGMQLNNPGNIGPFKPFRNVEEGVGAVAHQLHRYASGEFNGTPINTIRGMVSTYSPPSENDTEELIARASRYMGVPANVPLNLDDPFVLRRMTEATLMNEHGGKMPVTSAVLDAALGVPHSIQVAQRAFMPGDTFTDASGGSPDDWHALFNGPSPADAHSLPRDEPNPTVDGTPAAWNALFNDHVRNDAAINSFTPPADPGVLGHLQHAATYIPAMVGRAVAEALGWRQDALDVADKYLVQPVALKAANVLRQLQGKDPLTQQDADLAVKRADEASIIPKPTSEFFRTHLFGDKRNTSLPSELGDPERVSHYLEELGMPALMVGGAGLGSDITTAKTVGGAIGKILGHMGIGASTFGLGSILGEDILGEGGNEADQIRGSVFGTALEAARLGLVVAGGQGVSALQKYAPSWAGKYITGKIGPEAITRQNLDLPGSVAAANAIQGAHSVANYMVPGMELPPQTLSRDPGAQALMQVHVHHDRMAQARYNEIIDGNQAAIGQAEKDLVQGPGTPEQVRQYFQTSLENDRQGMIDRVNDAGADAQRAFEIASRGTNQSNPLLAQEILGRALGAALGEADNDLKAFANVRWNRARELGVDNVSTSDPKGLLVNKLKTLQAEAQRMGQGDRFPTDTLQPLFSAAAKPNSSLTVGQIREVASSLESDIRGERKAVASPFTQGDPKALRWMSLSAKAINDSIDQLLEGSGMQNLTAFRLATAATKNYYDLMHQGVVGKLRGIDLQGGEQVPPAMTAQKLVPGGLAGADATRDLFNVIHASNLVQGVLEGAGKSTTHPATTLLELTQQQLRQDFANTMNTGGWQHGQKWLDNNAVALQAFPGLQQEAQRAVDLQHNHFDLQNGVQSYDRDLEASAANNWLGGKIGQEVNYVFKSPDSRAAVSKLLDETAGDATGNASRGLARTLVDRMSAESKDAEGGYRPGAVLAFWRENAPVYQELADRGLLNFDNVQRIMNSYRGIDMMVAHPDRILTGDVTSNLSLVGLARKAANMMGAAIGRRMHSGTIQIPGIASELAGNVFDAFSPSEARNLQFDMMRDPELFQAVVNPEGATLMDKLIAQRKAIAPYIKAAPAILTTRLTQQPGPDTRNHVGEQFLPQ